MQTPTIIIADPQDITRLGLHLICSQAKGVKNIAEATNKEKLTQKLAKTPNALVVLDYTLFDLANVDELIVMQNRFEEANWLLFSERLSEYFIRRLLGNEKVSIVLKESTEKEISKAIAAALGSKQFVCQQIKNLLNSNSLPSDMPLLSVIEKEILKLMALGKSTKEIALERITSIHTVSTHRKNIFRKLDVNNVHEATKYALRAGIVDESEYYI